MKIPHTGRSRLLLIVGMLTLAALVAAAVYAGITPSASSVRRSTKAAATARKRELATHLDYPLPTSELPASITIRYDESKDRTRMTLSLDGVAVAQSPSFHVDRVQLNLVSEFAGRRRDPEHAELSARCTISLVTDTPGVLAPSSPPGQIIADSRTLRARAASADKSGYRSKRQSEGIHESLVFLISTGDLITIANAQSVSARFGALNVTLNTDQLSSLREFVARMNPTA